MFPFFHVSKFLHFKGFSFLEMLIVIMIVSILFVSFRSSFQIKNKDILYSQACIETIYGQVNNFLYAGLSSKSLFTWATPIFPEQYIISFMPSSGQRIQLKYTTGEDTTENVYASIEMTGNINNNYCTTNSYTIQLAWDDYVLYINKGIQENSTLQSFYLGTGFLSTGESVFRQCNREWTWCKKIARFESDIRTLQLKKYMCLNFSETGDCLEWDN